MQQSACVLDSTGERNEFLHGSPDQTSAKGFALKKFMLLVPGVFDSILSVLAVIATVTLVSAGFGSKNVGVFCCLLCNRKIQTIGQLTSVFQIEFSVPELVKHGHKTKLLLILKWQ